jgi:LemA protein
MIILYIIIGIVVLAILYVIASYNGFVTLVNRAKEAASDIEVQMKRRFDLIPNLVNVVKGYATHESGTLEKVIAARNSAMQASGSGSMQDKIQADNMLTGALKSIFALSEAYPDLKANTNFMELQRELTDTEDKIQSSRRFYNGNVRDLNIALEHFPGNVIANMFHFGKMELFDLPDGDAAQKPVGVKF